MRDAWIVIFEDGNGNKQAVVVFENDSKMVAERARTAVEPWMVAIGDPKYFEMGVLLA